MLLNIIVIVLRETLEASIIASVLLSIGQRYDMPISWLFKGLLVGFVGAVLYAKNLASISEMFDYVGQEVFNASLQILIYLLLAAVCVIQTLRNKKVLAPIMALIIALAVTREGGELVIFYSGFLQSASLTSAATSGFIGLSIGLSAGALCFYSIVSLSELWMQRVQWLLLVLIASGILFQASQLLIQADWLSVGPSLWDTNGLLPEASLVGQLVYAVFGYEARPSALELAIYCCSGLLIVAITGLNNYLHKKDQGECVADK